MNKNIEGASSNRYPSIDQQLPPLLGNGRPSQSWRDETTHGFAHSIVYDVAVSDGTIYAAARSGLSLSRDGGLTWSTKIALHELGSDEVRGIAVHGATVYAATTGGLSISRDGGEHFANQNVFKGFSDSDIGRAISIADGVVYVANGYSGLATSADEGKSWTFTKREDIRPDGPGDFTVDVTVADGIVYLASHTGIAYRKLSSPTAPWRHSNSRENISSGPDPSDLPSSCRQELDATFATCTDPNDPLYKGRSAAVVWLSTS